MVKCHSKGALLPEATGVTFPHVAGHARSPFIISYQKFVMGNSIQEYKNKNNNKLGSTSICVKRKIIFLLIMVNNFWIPL